MEAEFRHRSALAARVLPEPRLEFAHGQRLEDPRDGLSLFGPYSAASGDRPGAVTWAAIGTRRGLGLLGAWVERMGGPVPGETGKEALWPPYPGFDVAFQAELPTAPVWQHELDAGVLERASRNKDAHGRTFDVVERYLDGMGQLDLHDATPRVVVCVIPDFVYERCRPLSRVTDGHGAAPSPRERRRRRLGPDLFEPYAPEAYSLSVDFRRQFKARALRYDAPLQLVRESTISGVDDPLGRQLTPASDRAWNLGTTMYYKAGGKPWRLADARPGVCYIGIAFRRAPRDLGANTACCAAQMFLDSGDGIVFLGDYGRYYSPERRECHLDRRGARDLLAGALDTYRRLHGKPLTEVFLHSRSPIDAEEYAGFAEAVPAGVRLTGVGVRTERGGLRAYRPGQYPVVRGTCITSGERQAYLWAAGFKERIRTYDGFDVPAPLRIEVQHGDADIHQVATDILALTKLNYNTCRLGDSEPVTIGFSDAVGEILVANPTVQTRRPTFKFYI